VVSNEGDKDRDAHLSDEERREAAAGDLNVLAMMMLIGSTIFAGVNWWAGSLNWIAALATVSSTAASSVGLLKRNEAIAAFTKIGFGVSGLAAPVFGVAGLILGLFGISWGWALLAGSVLYFGFSVLGLEILDRAEQTGAIDSFEKF